jgi:hypothetical protein
MRDGRFCQTPLMRSQLIPINCVIPLAKVTSAARGPARGYKPRQVLEELPCLDARMLARRKLFPRDYSTHRYNLSFLSLLFARSRA